MTIEKKCENGFKWILKNHPKWIDNVDIDKLNQSDADNCIIGQNTNWDRFIEKEGTIFCKEHGFIFGNVITTTEIFKRLILNHRNQNKMTLLEEAKEKFKNSEFHKEIQKINKMILDAANSGRSGIEYCMTDRTANHYLELGFTAHYFNGKYTIGGWS